MALPINIADLIEQKVVEKSRLEYKDIYKKIIEAGDEVTAFQIAEKKIDQHKRKEKYAIRNVPGYHSV